MKTPQGFTLIEMLVVIAIISILATMMISLDFNRNTATLRRDRLVSKILSVIEGARLDAISGKSIPGKSIDSIQVTFSTGGTEGAVLVQYLEGEDVVGTGEVLKSPFFADPNYSIKDILWSNADRSVTGSIQSGSLIFQKTSASFTGTMDARAIRLEIGVNYLNQTGAIEIDRRTGRIGKVDIR